VYDHNEVYAYKSMCRRTSGRLYLVCSFAIAIIVLAMFSTAKVSQEMLVKRTLTRILKAERSRGRTLTPSEIKACRDRALVIVSADYSTTSEREANPIGIIAAVALLLQGAVIAFLKDFWAEYEQFLEKEPDWAGYSMNNSSKRNPIGPVV
jgi:hypothetical protein